MKRKVTATLLIFTMSYLTIYTSRLAAQPFPVGGVDAPFCFYGPDGTELTLFGDSRAWATSYSHDAWLRCPLHPTPQEVPR